MPKQPATTCIVRAAQWPEDLHGASKLLRHYEAFLNRSANIQLKDFDREIDELPQRWSEPSAAMLLAFHSGESVGCVAVRMLSGLHRTAEMKRMWSEPAARGQGIGHALVEAAIAWARSHGASELLLDTVEAAMPQANRLYTKLGFQPIARYNDNPVQNLSFFRLALS